MLSIYALMNIKIYHKHQTGWNSPVDYIYIYNYYVFCLYTLLAYVYM